MQHGIKAQLCIARFIHYISLRGMVPKSVKSDMRISDGHFSEGIPRVNESAWSSELCSMELQSEKSIDVARSMETR